MTRFVGLDVSQKLTAIVSVGWWPPCEGEAGLVCLAAWKTAACWLLWQPQWQLQRHGSRLSASGGARMTRSFGLGSSRSVRFPELGCGTWRAGMASAQA